MTILCHNCISIAEEEIEAMTEEQLLELVGDDPSEDEVDEAIIELFCGKIITITERDDPIIAHHVGGYLFYFCPRHYTKHVMDE